MKSSKKIPLKLEKTDKETKDIKSKDSIYIKKKYLLLIPLLIMLGGFIGIYFQPPGLQLFLKTFGFKPGGGTSTPIAVPKEVYERLDKEHSFENTNSVVGLGTILPISDVIKLDIPHGSSNARIEEIYVKEGDKVYKGQLVANLDNKSSLEASLKSAEVNLSLQEATLAQTIKRIKSEKNDILSKLDKAKAEFEIQNRKYNREKVLANKKYLSESDMDKRSNELSKSKAEIKSLEARLARYESDDINSQVDVVVASKNVELARAEFEKAKDNLSKSEVRAPIKGTILDIHILPGEKVSSNGVLSMGLLDRMKVVVEIYQNLRSKIEIGNKVDIFAESIGENLHGEVSSIGFEVKRQNNMEDNPAANADSRIIEVEVILDESSTDIAYKYTNMQVIAYIKAGKENGM